MKKFFLAGISALTLCAGFTSCSHEDFEPMTQAEIDKAKYDMAFLNYVGGKIAPNQDWGFSSTTTRGVTRAAEFGWDITSDYEATFDTQYYLDVFEYLPEGVNAGSELTDYEFVSKGPFQFSIIYSQTSGSDKVGYYYYNPKTQNVDDRTEVVFVDNIQNLGDYVQISYDGGSSWESMGTYAGLNPWNGGWGRTATGSRAKVFTVNVPAGYRVGFFLQQNDFKAYSNSDLNNETNGAKNYYSAVVQKDGSNYLVGLEDWNNQYGDSDLDCNDVIMAINGGNIPTPVDPDAEPEEDDDNTVDEGDTEEGDTEEGEDEEEMTFDLRIIAEDLSAQEAGDFDFNDVVFDVKFDATDSYIKILAAGGTLPLYIDGIEVHGALGAETNQMVNTNAAGGVNKDPQIIRLGYGVPNAEAAKDIKVEVEKNGVLQELLAPVGEAAAKIAVGTDFQWLNERESIKNAYPNFVNWVNEGFADNWWK